MGPGDHDQAPVRLPCPRCKGGEEAIAADDPDLGETSQVELCCAFQESAVCAVGATTNEEFIVRPRGRDSEAPAGVASDQQAVFRCGTQVGSKRRAEYSDRC